MATDPHPTAPSFDHNTSWTSSSVAQHYDARRFRSLGGRIYDRMEKRAILACLAAARQLAPVNEVLELACGTGRISELLVTNGCQLTCGDISEEMMAVARQRLHAAGVDSVPFRNMDIYDLDVPDGSFDCVCAFRLFQHLTSEERARALRELARVSRRFVLVNVMHTSAYYGTIRRLRRALGRYTTRYTSSSAEIAYELDYAGLRVVRSMLTQPGFNGNRVLLLEKKPRHG